VKFDVTDNNPGTTISTNCVVANSSNGGADPGPFTVASGRCANLTTTQFVPLLPLVNKTFGTPPSQFGTTIALNGTTVMTVTISNTNTASMTAINFIDTLPAGLQVANPPNVVNTTCGGTFAPVPAPGDTSLSYSGGSLGAGPSSCSISLNVTGVTSASAASGPSPSVCPALVLTAGQKENCVTVNGTVSGVPTVSLIANAIVTVTLPPPLPPSIAKSFAAATIQVGGSTTLSFLITNPNVSLTLTGITFMDTLPAGLVVSTPNGLIGTCDGGTITAVAGTNVISLGSPAATLPGGGSCVFSVNVTAISPGAWVNTTSQVTSIEGGPGNTATATLNVPSPPDAYQIHYISNPTVGGAVNLTNAGTLGACMFGPSGCATDVGDICVNVYVFQSDEQLEECCSCLVTPNALVHLSALDLIGNPGNGVTATNGIVVKLIATIPGTGKIPGTQAGPFTGTFCSPAYPFDVTNLAPGMRAWATTLHALTATAPVTYALTEGKFQTETLSPGELTMVTNLCRFIVGNGSGAGICKSCVPSSGALGGSKQ